MSELIKTKSEQNFQERLIFELSKSKWKISDELNGNKKRVTVNDLVNNWRSELNRMNADQLEGIELTDNEFHQVMSKVNQLHNSFDAARLLAMEGSTGKIDGIYRESHPDITRNQITLTIFKKAEVAGGDSSYTVATEVWGLNDKTRFDVILLINGLPLINIELKRADKSMDEAFEQFKRYYRNGDYSNNFMAFSQMMIMMSEVETRYFATPKSLKEFNKSFVFHWADVENNPIHDMPKVAGTLLKLPMAHQMVGDYLVIDESKNEENRRHMLMRPYQVYALQAVERAALGWDNDNIPHGGYVWHTTGSGKTITSFKTALVLSTRIGFDKVVFLVDRRELDQKTSDNFKAYAKYESVTVDDTKHTHQLTNLMRSPQSGIIVTTTFKLNAMVKELDENNDESLKNKKIVFITDEAHRTTMGQMMGTIKDHFKKNGLFYGFTGTPLFEENNVSGKINEKSEIINTTEKLFGPELHTYSIDRAIADNNVLGFHIDYINTGEFLGYESLREDILKRYKVEFPEIAERDLERKAQLLNELEIEEEAKKYSLLEYHDQTHIPRVVEEMLNNWEFQSQKYFFNAILTVALKDRVVNYYREFKKQIANRNQRLNVAMTFSFGNENDPDNVPIDVIEEMFEDYSKFTHAKFSADDLVRSGANYFEDLVERSTRGGSERNPRNIDLIIVADQLLTGYDSKYLNTLYVDRDLKLQGLIQAYSRTNRLFGAEKEFGTIINFKYPKITEEKVKQALKLYGSGGTSNRAIVDRYDVAVEKFSISIDRLRETLKIPTNWVSIKNTENEKYFIEQFYESAGLLSTVQQYYEYFWKDEDFNLTEHEWLLYLGAYRNLLESSGTKPPAVATPLIGKTKLSGSQVIDAKHIVSLIGEKTNNSGDMKSVDQETIRVIYEQIQELSDLGEDVRARQLKEFVDTELIPGKISSDQNFDDAFDQWIKNRVNQEIKVFSDDWGVDYNLIKRTYDKFDLNEPKVIPFIDDLAKSVDYNVAKDQSSGSPLLHNIYFTENLKEWMMMVKSKY